MPGEPEERIEILAPGYLAKVRKAAGRLAVRPQAADSLSAAIDDLVDDNRIDIDVPTQHRRPSVTMAKRVVKAAIGWYLRYVSQQVMAFGDGVVRLGRALEVRTDALDAQGRALAERVEQLEGRVERLEQPPRPRRPAAAGKEVKLADESAVESETPPPPATGAKQRAGRRSSR